MVEGDPFRTQRDVGIDVVAELGHAGFEDAEEIGRGGFGMVFRCVQHAIGRTVAVKVLTGRFEEDRERFFREQRAMGRLTGHPNIVDMLEVGETASGLLYLVMPYHSHGSLDTRIRTNGPLRPAEVLSLGVKIAGALEAAHRAEILHRDIKPGNILLTDYGEPALTDFGIAHVGGGFKTATGTVTGSPAFTAPEVLGGEGASPASDVYGLGATLFCALTGHAAFERREGEQLVAQFLRITEEPVPDLRENGIPDDICSAVEAAMSRDPRDRPTVLTLGQRLRQIERDHGLVVDEMILPTGPRTGLLADHVSAAVPMSAMGNNVGNLPLELTSFVDRRLQVAAVKSLLARSRLVTLTGIGGVGKSRLALRVAHKVRTDFNGGAWLVELGDLTEPTLVPDAVAVALGLRNRGARPMVEAMEHLLSNRDVLLVLDNCEQVIDAVTSLAESLLQTYPQLRILATSREALSVGGEAVFSVPPLDVPVIADQLTRRVAARYDAVALFAERGAAAVPGFEITEDTDRCVARICARLDGLPLAIELAAARLRTMSPEQILSRLDDRYELLTRGSRGAPVRQQTLRWCIGWSYDLCTPVEQRLWAQLSVFVGGFEFDAAQQVCGHDLSEAEVLDGVSALVDKSILIREEIDAAIRFRMLENVQEYGREKAEESGNYREYERRHRNWCEQLALTAGAEWVGPDQLRWIARLDRELPNLRKALELGLREADDSALRIASALYLFWTLRGRLSEGRRWSTRALDRTTDARITDRAKSLYSASVMAAMQGDLPAAAGTMARLETLADEASDPLVAALFAHAEGTTYITGDDDDLARARPLLLDALDTYEASGDLKLQLDALIALGCANALQGDVQNAAVYLKRALEIAEFNGETMFRSWASWAAGFTDWKANESDRAVHMLRQGIRSARLVADPLIAAACSETMAWIEAQAENYRRAAVLTGAADSLGRVAGSSAFMFRKMRVYRDDCFQSCRKALGNKVFESARKEGAAMSFDAAVGYALGEGPGTIESEPRSEGKLTKRERQVAGLVAQGLTNRAIAGRLVISPRTAEGHVEHILTKLGFTSRAQIAAWAAAKSDS
ncbi:protein kinase domain-containing protein [Nocardia anaemiae]|uniref:protein kinase domain-containing protein n=1 Tax=Nocardia anaemiae TaxID=263910 RepID=UPI0007A45547|nr:protein kinase [Nocardia anaemiae]